MKLSIIIPSYNEANDINDTIGTLLKQAKQPPFEIIVVDGGSGDDRIERICHPQVVSVVNPRLAEKKWLSLRFGASIAQGNTLLFLNPDTLVPHHFDEAIDQSLKNPAVVGGAFEFSFDKFSLPLFCISLFNRLRYRFRKRFYGEQGIFVRKSAYDEAGGWPQRSVLEAAYFCKKLRQFGKLRLIKKQVISPSSRFTNAGIWVVFMEDCKIWALDLVGVDVEKWVATNKGKKQIVRSNKK